MASRSANVLVIFIVAIFAFCFASVFASMTGPIAVLPENNDSEMMLDNITIVPNNSISNDNSKYQSYQKQTNDDTDDDSSDNDKSNVETTVDKTTKDKKTSDDSNTKDTSSDKGESSGSDDVETTTDET